MIICKYRGFKITQTEKLSNTRYYRIEKESGRPVYMPDGTCVEFETISAPNFETVLAYIDRIHF